MPAPPEEEQPHPNQDLLEGHFKGETELAGLPDVNHKVSLRGRLTNERSDEGKA